MTIALSLLPRLLSTNPLLSDANDTTGWSPSSIASGLALLMASLSKIIGAIVNYNGTLVGCQIRPQ